MRKKMTHKSPYFGMPLYLYNGHKKFGIPSDRHWIEWQLKRLPKGLVEKACEQYDIIFLTTNLDREIANTWLKDFCDFHGCTTEELRYKLFGRKPSKLNQDKADNLVSKVRQSVKRKSILDMADQK